VESIGTRLEAVAVTHRPAVVTATASATLLGAAVVHASVVDEHFAQWWAEGAFFLMLQVVESALALALVRRASRSLCIVAIAVSAGTVALWIVSRTVGVPAGPGAWQPEPVGRPDVTATALELATALVLVPLVRAGGSSARRPAARGVAVAAAVLAVAAATALGVTGRGQDQAQGHAHGGQALGPGEYPLGKPLRRPTRSQGTGFFFEAQPLRRVVLELGVGPARPGINTFDVVVVDHAGQRVDAPLVRVTASPPARDRKPLPFAAARIGPGHFVVHVARLTETGTWRVLVTGLRDGRVAFRHAFAVPIAHALSTP
jgi:hypothetical protein